MGMAASQARFLGLTARKSNVEYQGQQINQQRAALATESSNLYHQMMTLEVPTPPVTTDYYKTVYTLDDSAMGNCGAYTIESLTKTYNGTNNYTVKLNTVETNTSAANNTFLFTKISRDEETDDANNSYYTYTTTLNGTYVNYDPKNCTAYKKDSSTGNNVLTIVKGNIYKIDDATSNLLKDNDGYNAVKEQLVADGVEDQQLYFYQDTSGKNCYMTQEQLDRITSEAFEPDCSYNCTVNGNVANIASGTYMNMYFPTQNTSEITREVNATLETTSSGRYSSIAIEENENYPANLSGRTFSITTSSKYDDNAYKDAYSDYEYSKAVYEQTISDINSQTEIIQSEDKQLELRLQQLDTEQESISTEMDSVTKVIEDNIQKTFDAFG